MVIFVQVPTALILIPVETFCGKLRHRLHDDNLCLKAGRAPWAACEPPTETSRFIGIVSPAADMVCLPLVRRPQEECTILRCMVLKP